MTALDVDPSRAAKAARALRDGDVDFQRQGPSTFRVRSFTRDRSYRVQLNGKLRCNCPDHRIRGETCKHLVAVALVEGLEGA